MKGVQIDVGASIDSAYEILLGLPDRCKADLATVKLLEAQTYALLAIAESLRAISKRGRGI